MNKKTSNEDNPNTSDVEISEPELELVDAISAAADVADSDAGELEKLKVQLADAEKKALLAVADLENYRKRSGKQLQEQIRYASLPLMSELLEAVDNLNRAVESAAHETSADSGLIQGVKMVVDQLMAILSEHHCKPIEAVGKPFDPNLHQAVQMQASDDVPANTVIQELRRGYQLHERIVRPSQVMVSTGNSGSMGAGENTES